MIIDGRLEREKDEVARQVILAPIRPSDWLPLPEKYESNFEIGFDVGGVKVRANVNVHEDDLIAPVYTVEMTYPVRNYACGGMHFPAVFGKMWHDHLADMKTLLEGMYADWMILRTRRDEIAVKFNSFPRFVSDFHLREEERIVQLRARLAIVEKRSSELELELHCGHVTPKEYKQRHLSLHKQMISLGRQMEERDAFEEMFREEMDCCRFAFDKRGMIESVCRL